MTLPMRALKVFLQDCSVSAVVTGLIAVMVSYAGPLVIVFQAANSGQLTPEQLSSWLWAISIGSGVSGLWLSLRYRTPVITAWSTPGAALLVTSLAQYRYSDAIGAYMFSALLITLLGVTGLFSRLMARLPVAVVAAMLAGVLFRFGVGVFSSLAQGPALVLPILLVYLVARRTGARYAIMAALISGVLCAFFLNLLDFQGVSATLAEPQWTTPSFSLSAMIGLGIPLCFVTMASQNAPGIAVLRTAGYDVPVNPLVTVTGLASVLLAPFGAHGINLAAITAAICTGAESHPLLARRYVAGVSCALLYLLVGSFGATMASVFASLPGVLMASIAGLALFSALANGLGVALANESQREPALITFLVTASGISFFGIGAACWGLVFGVLADRVLFGKMTVRRADTQPD